MSPQAFWRLPGAGGFRAACRARFRLTVPVSPLRVGVSTWICPAGMPIFSGRRVRHRSTTVCTSRSGDRRHRKKKSFCLFFRSGDRPRFTAWALRMMADCSAWRNTSVRVTDATEPLRRISPSTLPGPTEGSWSGSPTITRRHPGFRAARRASISGRSTMLISSTMTASASSRSFSFFLKATSPVSSLKVMPRQRWMVWASREHSSLMRLAARPVGASSRTVRPMRSSRVTMPRVEVVLPVPGPPVSSSTPLRAASSTARRCWGA